MYQPPVESKIVDGNRGGLDFSIPMATSIFVTLCFCPILGCIGMIFTCLGMRGQREGQPNTAAQMKKMANYANLTGFLVGVLLLAAVLTIAFVHKGAQIYFPPPGTRNHIYWQSNA